MIKTAIIATIVAIAVVAGYDELKSTAPPVMWSGSVYPNKAYLTTDIPVGVFYTLGHCRKAAQHMIDTNRWPNPDYECGSNCRPSRPDADDPMLICDETIR
jgi:hypothetical protein